MALTLREVPGFVRKIDDGLMMRKILLLGVVLIAPGLAQAAVVTETGQIVRAGQTVDNGYLVTYNFAPIAIPANNIISFQLDFVGGVSPRVGGASGINIVTGNTITSVNVIPVASFASSLLNGPSLSFPNQKSVQGAQVSEAYDNVNNVSVSPFATPLSLSQNSGPGVPADLFATTSQAAVSLFALPGNPFVTEPNGSTATFPGGANIDRSSGIGSLTLTLTYNPVPEPASLVILGFGLLGLTILGRRHSI